MRGGGAVNYHAAKNRGRGRPFARHKGVSMFRRILIGVGALVGVLLVVAYLLPRQVHVERSVLVDTTPAVVFPLVDGFRRFNEFSPWAEADPNAKYVYGGPDTGVGARLEWSGDPNTVGSGSQEIVASEPNRLVKSKLDFGDQGVAEATWSLAPEDAGTRVTWAFDTDLGMNPMARYFGLFFDGMIGKDYEKGLAKLKTLAEREAAALSQETAVAPTVAAEEAAPGATEAAPEPQASSAPAQ
jgi:hypothetical protein